MMPTSLSLDTVQRVDGELVLVAAGEIDLSNVEAFTTAISTAIAEIADSGRTLTVDLSSVEYLDSAAINVLFLHAEQIRVIAHPLLVRVFDISGLSELAAVEPAPPKAER